jgi:hypothetical protein
MLVILTQEQLMSPQQVCSSCLLADADGQPRWRQGVLGCGQPLRPCAETPPRRYRCQMGFQVAEVQESLTDMG